jgi:hypothetical protein
MTGHSETIYLAVKHARFPPTDVRRWSPMGSYQKKSFDTHQSDHNWPLRFYVLQ